MRCRALIAYVGLVAVAAGLGTWHVRAAQSVPAPRTGQTSRLTGTVVRSDSHVPLADAAVTLSTSENEPALRSMTTARDGRFDFQQLPPGRYWLAATRSGFARTVYGQTRPGRLGRPIDLVAGQTLDGVTIAVLRGGVLSGSVFGPDGEPVANANVSAYRYGYRDGVRDPWPPSYSEPLLPVTDDRGAFRISGLEPGDYFIGVRVPRTAAAGQPSTADDPKRAGTGNFSGDLVFYPGTPLLSSTSAVSLAAGEERSGLDVRLSPEAVVTVSGVARGVNRQGVRAVVQIGLEGNPTIASLRADAGPDGRFTFPTVPPGTYTLFAHSLASDGSSAPMRLVVVDKPLTQVNVELEPAHAVSGHLTWRGDVPPSAIRGRVMLQSVRQGLGNTTSSHAIAGDGVFRLDAVPAGRYFVALDNLPAGWSLRSVTIDGRDFSDTALDVDGSSDITDVTIEATKSSTELRGTVAASAGQPAADATVIAFPEDERLVNRFSRRILASETSADGAFLFRGLPPGDYLLALVEDIEPGAWLDPEVLKTLRAAATRVHLSEGEQKSIALRFSR